MEGGGSLVKIPGSTAEQGHALGVVTVGRGSDGFGRRLPGEAEGGGDEGGHGGGEAAGVVLVEIHGDFAEGHLGGGVDDGAAQGEAAVLRGDGAQQGVGSAEAGAGLLRGADAPGVFEGDDDELGRPRPEADEAIG